MAVATIDPAFTGAGAREGLEIWRIEKFQPKQIDKQKQGTFYSGDSYVMLSTKISKAGGLDWSIHFWIGSESSQDEYGTAAIKSVELDEYLGGGPVQYREVQGHESKMFLSYFPKGVKYLSGGIESGFKKVVQEEIRRLYHLKGKRNVRMTEVPMKVVSLNHGDAFVLDLGTMVYVWLGNECGRMERMKAIDAARNIRDDERAGKARIEILEELLEEDDSEFFKFLGGKDSGEIGVSTPDEEFERRAESVVSLYHITDSSGELEMTQLSTKPLLQKMLDSQDAFLVDSGAGVVYAWIGKGATKGERKAAMHYAVSFIKEKSYSPSTPLVRVIDGAEPVAFKALFQGWQDPGEVENVFVHRKKGYEAPEETKVEDLVSQMKVLCKREEASLLDDGKGDVQIWRVENFEMAPVDPKTYGQFYAGDAYLLFYKYLLRGKEHYVIYFWLGQASSQDEREAAALHAIALDDQYAGAPVQVRVVQGKEPSHFLKLFEGRMIVHAGGKASGFKNRNEMDFYDTDGIRLFHLKGLTPLDTRAVQVAESATSLNSGDVFVLETPKATYIWHGKSAGDSEKLVGENVARILTPNREATILLEESEPTDFWQSLGGYKSYAKQKCVDDIPVVHEPRLFQVSNASGRLCVEEIADFVQEDLVQDDVMILDTYDEIFVWIGLGANVEEKKGSLQTVKEYMKTDPSGRNEEETTLLQINQGHEPPNFTAQFIGWNYDLWSQSKNILQVRAEINAENAGISVDESLANYGKKYTYEDLRNVSFEGVDSTRKEDFLLDGEFEQVFRMSRAEFAKLPIWKKLDAKRKLDLY